MMHDDYCPAQHDSLPSFCICVFIAAARVDEREEAAQRVEVLLRYVRELDGREPELDQRELDLIAAAFGEGADSRD